MEEREIQYFEQFGETIQDEYGGLYSADGVWLLSAPTGRHKTYRIKEGTQIIAHYSFMGRFDDDNDMYIDPCNIEEVEMPNSVVYIENEAFWECQGLKTIKLSQSIKKIPCYCFWRCLSLESVVIPNSVTIIEEGAFMWCQGLRRVYLPKSICEIGEGAFKSCESLEKIIVPNGTKDRFIAMLDEDSARLVVEENITN
jgi:hypothetical protein